jgi:6-phosphogluconolactonase
MRYLFFGLLIVLGLLATTWAESGGQNRDCWVYVGNEATGENKGIYLLRMDGGSGKLAPAGIAAVTTAPNFLAVHPSGKWLYAVTAAKVDPQYSGAVETFAMDAATGKLTFLNRQASGAAGPVHVAVDPSGKCAVVADYSGASVASFPIEADGRLGEARSVIKHAGSSVDKSRQKQPYPHGVAFDRQGKHVLVADLGTDKVVVYDIDAAAATLKEHGATSMRPGSGPRHLAFSEDGKLVYVVSEMGNTLTQFAYGDGTLKDAREMLPWEDAVKHKDYLAEVAVMEKFVYLSERGKDAIAVMDGEKVLQKIDGGGKWPRHFGIDPSGRFLLVANQRSNSVTELLRDPEKGTLTATTEKAEVPVPVCVVFIPIQP